MQDGRQRALGEAYAPTLTELDLDNHLLLYDERTELAWRVRPLRHVTLRRVPLSSAADYGRAVGALSHHLPQLNTLETQPPGSLLVRWNAGTSRRYLEPIHL